jgi:hypothetical protein
VTDFQNFRFTVNEMGAEIDGASSEQSVSRETSQPTSWKSEEKEEMA